MKIERIKVILSIENDSDGAENSQIHSPFRIEIIWMRRLTREGTIKDSWTSWILCEKSKIQCHGLGVPVKGR